MYEIDETHAPARTSFVASANGHSDFPIQNLPLGVFSRPGEAARGGIAIGEEILDLAALAASGLLEGEAQAAAQAACADSLNQLLALGAASRRALRRAVSALLASDSPLEARVAQMLVPMAQATMHLPARIGDYTDFYVGIHHARTVGSLFRPENPLLPNYRHLPIGYHGRASTVRAPGAEVVRPRGQVPSPGGEAPVFTPSARLDYELELGLWVGPGNDQGAPIPIAGAEAHMAGLTLLNDWSARDMQAWEYQPLGPFLAKNFHTTVSPWLVTMEALAPFRGPAMARSEGDPPVLPYLVDAEDALRGGLSLSLEVALSSAAMRDKGLEPLVLSRGEAAQAMYWTLSQMLTHHASNGCAMQPGDLLGSGTLSGPPEEKGAAGSLLEITLGGKHPLALPSGETRRFLEDGDAVTLSGRLHAEGYVAIGFGPCSGTIAPAPAG